MDSDVWTVAEAKAKFSEVLENAQKHGPQAITRNGQRAAVADECGRLVAGCETGGRPIHAMDALIAATAQVHGLTLVTRNVSDFQFSLKSILNPWK
jgi:predicted nucleic acid-binding protein